MTQGNLLLSYLVDPKKAKKGTDKCPSCGRLVRWYAKTLDKRLVAILEEFYHRSDGDWVSLREVFTDHHKINDFQKLHYFDLVIRHEKKSLWKVTGLGRQFLLNQVQIPYRVWVFDNEVKERDDSTMTSISKINPRWQESKSDYTFDYINEKVSVI